MQYELLALKALINPIQDGGGQTAPPPSSLPVFSL